MKLKGERSYLSLANNSSKSIVAHSQSIQKKDQCIIQLHV
jgi:hypothetical protein